MEEKKGLDINFFIGMLLIMGIIWYMGQPVPVESNSTQTEHLNKKSQHTDLTSLNNDQYQEQSYYYLSNNLLTIKFSNLGASVKEVILKNYVSYDSLELKLVNDFNFSIDFFLKDKRIETNNLLFSNVSQYSNSLVFTFSDNDNNQIDFTYELIDNSYELIFNIKVEEGNSYIEPSKLHWSQNINQLEKNINNERNATTIRYSFDNQSSKELSLLKDVEKNIKSPTWIAYKQQFFSTILYSNNIFNETTIKTKTPDTDEYIKHLSSEMDVEYNNKHNLYSFSLYFIPNKYALLKSYNKGFESLIPLGWGIFGWVNKFFVIPIFNFLEGFQLNYGVIILIMALLVKIILFFPTKSSYVSMAKMRVLKPDIDAINEKIKDPLAKQQAQMNLYKKTGVNPLGGCLPLLFQMPILIALFRFFPASIELRQQPFLWADDLSTYDSILDFGFNVPLYGDHISLFALLMTLATLLQMVYSNQMTPANTQMPQMKYVMYFMPIVFLFVMNNYSSGLSYYYFLANLITFGQQFIIRRNIDDEKLYAVLQQNKKKPIKKSKFQQRLEEMAKQKRQ